MMKNKKKSAPVGTQILEQDHSTTPERKSHAQKLFDRIGTGKKNALKVDNKNWQFRALVANANMNGDCIINVGNGYYRAGPDDKEDVSRYLWREMHRAEVIEDKVQAMREAYFGRY